MRNTRLTPLGRLVALVCAISRGAVVGAAGAAATRPHEQEWRCVAVQPGDTLWGLTKVLYAEKARSVEAALEVRSDLDEARSAISVGEIEEARVALDEARGALEKVSEPEDRGELEAQHSELMTKVTEPAEAEEAEPAPAEETTTKPETTDPTTSPSPTTDPTTSPSPTTEPTEPTTSPKPTTTSGEDTSRTDSQSETTSKDGLPSGINGSMNSEGGE
jgi:hypothetical protein